MNKVGVLGSLNMDLVTTTERLPQVGETMFAQKLNYFIGGKGANQAVAASRADAKVTMLGKVGADGFGEQILQTLANETLDIKNISKSETVSTGIANIFKLPNDNCIAIVPGANFSVNEEYVGENESLIKQFDILLTQLEIPIDAVSKALNIAKKNGVKTILNPAPLSQDISFLFENIDFLTPNEIEFQALYPYDETNISIETAMLEFSQLHPTVNLIVTRGKLGVSYVESNLVKTIPAQKVSVVDTTGAGDTFNGILAAEISRGESLGAAISFATVGSGLSVQKFGAQTGMPTYEEIKQAIK